MSAKKLAEDIGRKSDRELLEMQTFSQLQQEKHLHSIAGNVQFFFWITIIGIFLGLFAFMLNS